MVVSLRIVRKLQILKGRGDIHFAWMEDGALYRNKQRPGLLESSLRGQGHFHFAKGTSIKHYNANRNIDYSTISKNDHCATHHFWSLGQVIYFPINHLSSHGEYTACPAKDITHAKQKLSQEPSLQPSLVYLPLPYCFIHILLLVLLLVLHPDAGRQVYGPQ